ncbi:sodium:solute symporter family transporter [Parvularcula dongshanensis]|uniref:SSS family solute:Na+ symporter n=1 Tax=Parvularcula dongshanensis TaxID=1173995 RepID=A0A840I8X8_9PROT|nr:sodium/solute symporter [Parvularcula dongshanensis]MBB4660400.1 SSS family solute:Na+ symporter [Parvularcula dongshanensis]
MQLTAIDLLVVLAYAIGLFALALFVSRERPGHKKNTEDYFLAGKALPWWAIGASLIAANISAEQIIGMSGSGFAVGLAIASYEWMAAITLVIVGKFFLPIFLERGIVTMPQFLEGRFGPSVKYVMSVFWLVLYTVVNLTTIMWLGATAVNTLTGLDMFWGMAALGAFAAAYSLYGGLKAVALTDIVQVVLLVFGGILITWIALNEFSGGQGALEGFAEMQARLPERFDMILSRDNPEYQNLPGIGVLIGGLWIMNLSYWGFNQYIIQRALGAKSIREAQAGVLFAGFLKLLMPFIIVLPGIAAVVLAPEIDRPDQAYPAMMAMTPVGIRGLIFAALIAAIVSSLGSMMNSISTIFTLDLVRPLLMPNAPEGRLVTIGRSVSFAALVLALFLATPLLGNSPQVFQNIQNWTGLFTPGVVAIFFLGMFWKRATEIGGLFAVVSSVVLSLVWPALFPDMPFMDRVGLVFLLALGIGVAASYLQKPPSEGKVVDLRGVSFTTGPGFNLGAVVIVAILIFLYGVYW